MRETLVCDVLPRIDGVSPAEWQRLFPDLPDSLEMLQLIQGVGLNGFRFHSIVIREGERPILLLPLFETVYDLSTLVEPAMRPVIAVAARKFQKLLRPRLLGIGFVEAEWGQVGVDPSVDRKTLATAWDLALQALEALADGLGAELIAFVNFTSGSGRWVPTHLLSDYTQVTGFPYGTLPIVYRDLEHYLRSLSTSMRRDLRRKMRQARDVKVVRTRTPGPWLETIYQYYVETVRRSDVVFGIHPRAYFEQICAQVPGAEYWLYLSGETLLAFRLVVISRERLLDKYFGMHPVLGRERNLYFISWIENIRYCIEQQIPYCHAGQSAEAMKARLGAELIPSLILFRHRHRFIHRIFVWLAQHVAERPAVALPPVQLGTGWDVPLSAEPIGRETPTHDQISMSATRIHQNGHNGQTDEPCRVERSEDEPAEQPAR